MFENLTLYEAFKNAATQYPNGIAIFYRGKKISYKKLLKLVDRQADILHNRLDINAGDMIMLAQPNIPDTLVLLYALNKIGAVVNLVHPFTPYNQVVSLMKNTSTKYAFLFEQRVAKEVDKYRTISDKIFVTRIENYLPLFSKCFYHLFMNNKIRIKLGKSHKFPGFKYVHKYKPTFEKVEEHYFENKTSIVLHSGSTTGDPKSICLSDKSFNYIADNLRYYTSIEDYDRLAGMMMLSVLPSFHGFGLAMTMHMPLVKRMGIVLIPKFTTKDVTKALNKTKFKFICGVPTMYEKLFKDEKFIKNKNFKNIYACFSGGDGFNQVSLEKMNNIFKARNSNCRIYEGYGLTEALAVNCVNTPNFNKLGSIGKPIPGCSIKLLDNTHKEVLDGQVGEIAIKSDALMLKYFNDPDATIKTFYDGYLLTGDYGYKDKEGFIYFKSRVKRVVKVSGVAVFPSEVEKLIVSIPEVEEVAAIGVPDDQLQNAIKVFVVSSFFDKEELIQKILDTCRKYLIRWAVPKQIEFIDKLPVTNLGKVDYKKLENK